MSKQITLAPMPKGCPMPTKISKTQMEYIDQNHKYLTPSTMARDLNIPQIMIIGYCTEMKYETVKVNRAVPKKKNDERYFSADKWSAIF